MFIYIPYKDKQAIDDAQMDLQEMRSLAITLGFCIIHEFQQILPEVNAKTLIGKGKLSEIHQQISQSGCSQFLVNCDLSASQHRNLEKFLGIRVLDKTSLVLEIFEKHATTSAAKTQISLAKLRHELPRLSGMWQHLDREKGGTNVSKGTGERQIEIDRKLIRRRIARLKSKLKEIQAQKKNLSYQKTNAFRVALVGYTNAGKSSLLQALTSTSTLVADRLFSTLDAKFKAIDGKSVPKIIFSDTVGFLRNLPPQIIASFHSTLQGIKESDLLLHVIDASDPHWAVKRATTHDILQTIEAENLPRIMVFNKIDKLSTDELCMLQNTHPDALFTSSMQKKQIEILKEAVRSFFLEKFATKQLLMGLTEQKKLHFLFENGTVNAIDYQTHGIHTEVSMSHENWQKFQKFFGP